MANQASYVQSVDELMRIWIVIAFQINFDITDDGQWIGERDHADQDVRHLADERRDGRRWWSVDQNRYND
jgi:hypothetical protein